MAIEKRPFGRTGQLSSAVIFGAAAIARVDQPTADRALELLLEFGVNHIDTAAAYGDSELRIRPWMARHRDDFFLASKTRERSFEGARAGIRQSLERLGVERLDLIQLHALIHPDEWDQAMAPGGALEAAIEAREEGLVRFIGVTGHGWNVAAMHRRALARFDFDAVLMPWNWFASKREAYVRDFAATVEICQERGIAVQTIKAVARGPWAAGAARRHSTWYQPLEDEEEIRTAVHWLLAEPGFFLNSVGDLDLLPAVLRAAAADPIRAPAETVMAAHAERTGLASIFGI